jgi:hypothetical protein
MRSFRVLMQSRNRVLGTLIIAPMLYAMFALIASAPARSQTGCSLVSCQYEDQDCYYESGGVGVCCYVCRTYSCPDGSTQTRCRTECGVQC